MSLPPDSNRLSPAQLPTPFSAEEIRAACAPGRGNTYLVTRAGAGDHVLRWEFTGGDEHVGESIRWTESPEGESLDEPRASTSSWAEFQAHASYPEATTTLTEERVIVPAGEFDGWLYTTVEGAETSRNWFARDLPGPPVRVLVEVGGRPVYTMALTDFTDPRSSR